ncbi:MAG: hypothetical protein ABS36_18890 [Acidobacteria bacterium SCN 69-37]|nr:MAG: hypothetical protein ABS36_18890 [Acidobacteria bacterium SCN 69-37]
MNPTTEHQWLTRLVGDWTFSLPAPKIDDARVTTIEGTETYRALGPLWVIGDAVAPLADGGLSESRMALGWDPQRRRFVGTRILSTTPSLWVYDGEGDPDGRRLRLYTEGPATEGATHSEPLLDVIAFVDANSRTLTRHTKAADGSWTAVLTVEYRRR